MAVALSLCSLWFHLLSAQRFDSVCERLIGRAALGAVALVGALAIVECEVPIQVSLQLFEGLVERLPKGHRLELLFHGAEALAGRVTRHCGDRECVASHA